MEIDFDIFLAWYTAPKIFSDFFKSMTKEQAAAYLQTFLGKRDEYLQRLWSRLLKNRVVSNPEVIFERKMLDSIVDWVVERSVCEAKEGKFFGHTYPYSDELKADMVGAAFYWGEWMIRYYSDFRWKVGHMPVRRYVMQNVPVISNHVRDYDGDEFNPILGVIGGCISAFRKPDKPRRSLEQRMDGFVDAARRAH